MAKSSGVTTTIQTEVYYSETFLNAAPTYANLSADGAGVFIPANKIKDVVDVGDLGDEATILRYTPLGEPTEKTVAGVAGLPEWDFTFVLDESDTVHGKIRAVANGTRCSLALVTKTGDSAITVDYILGQVASKRKIVDAGAPTQLAVTIAMAQSPVILEQA